MDKSNSFKNIEPEENLPKNVKDETLGSLYSVKLFIDVLDLFFIKAGGVAGRSLSSDDGPESPSQNSHNTPAS